ncbi:MAG TPA: xanthine dehydrogenase family protein subunit M [Symbiobacteriaceae bacterium]|jgi:CO/xanthine dehydrogenase FAD-binding subunit
MADEVQVYSPATLPEAFRLLAEYGPDVRPLAGGTDAVVKLKDGLWRPRAWVNLLKLRDELAYIRFAADEVRIGSLTTFGEMIRSPELQLGAPLLIQAARTIGGPAIRNLATLGGNLGTASPAGDSLPALYCLDARVCLAGAAGEREVPIADFFRGPGKTALTPGELITGIAFAPQAPEEMYSFEKLGLRAAHAISLVSAAVRLVPASSTYHIGLARVALGAVAPTVFRVAAAEDALTRCVPLTPEAVREAAWAARAASRPISDIRAGAEYRRAMAENLVLRGLVRALGPAEWEEALRRA